MKKNLTITFLLLVIVGYGLMRLAISAISDFDSNLVSSKVSPNGQYTVFEFESTSEGGHAPYGQELVLTNKKNIKSPEDGYIIFAGYCNRPMTYSWKSNNAIQVVCESNEKITIRTKSDKAFDINIEVIENNDS